MSVREHDFNREIANLFQQIRYEWRTNPVILGGSSGSEGGSTGAPGGTIGQVGQKSVAGDTTEGPFLISSGSIGSLLDNLKRIRYWELPTRQFGLEEHVPAESTWIVSSGSWYHTTATDPLIYLGGNTPPITLPSSGSRLDLLTISTSGVLQWLSGTSGSAPTIPTPPSVTSGSMPLWAVVVRSSGSVCHNYDRGENSHYIFRDMRPFLDWGIGGAGGSSGSFVPGSIPFGSGSGVLTEENQYLYWDTVYKRLMRGTNTFGAYESIFAFPGIYNVNINNDGSGFVPVAYGAGSPGITGIKINGTIASPTGVLDGNVLVRMSGRGWGATAIGSASRSRFEAVAVGNWTDVEQGSKWDFYTTGSATTTVTKAVTITDTQELQIHNLTTDGGIVYATSSGIVRQGVLKYTNSSNRTDIFPPDVGVSTPTELRVSGGAASGTAGDLVLRGGSDYISSGNGGNVVLSGGQGASTSGSIKMRDADSGISAIFNTKVLSGIDKIITIPNSDGTLSLREEKTHINLISPFLELPELRGFWPISSVNESGNILDLSGQGRTLTNNNAASRAVYGDLVPYVDLDGSNQYFSRADESGLDITGAITVMGWFRFDAASSTFGIAGKWTDGTQAAYLLYYDSFLGNMRFALSSAGTGASSVSIGSIAPTVGTWYFIAGRLTPSIRYSITVNGTVYSTTTSVPAAIFNSNADLEVGAYNGAGNYMNGQVGPIAICATALSDAHLGYVFERTRGAFGV